MLSNRAEWKRHSPEILSIIHTVHAHAQDSAENVVLKVPTILHQLKKAKHPKRKKEQIKVAMNWKLQPSYLLYCDLYLSGLFDGKTTWGGT